MPRHYRDYSDKDIVAAAEEVESLAGLLRKLNLKATGGNYGNMRRHLQRLKVDTTHWKGQGWSKEKKLKNWGEYTRGNRLKPHLIRERGHRCERCRAREWMENPIPLEIHHVNGDRTDNRPENLKLLCCNCHAQTNNWRGKQ